MPILNKPMYLPMAVCQPNRLGWIFKAIFGSNLMQLKRQIGLLNNIGSSLLLLTLMTACSGKSEADKLTKELQTVTSWAATAEMTGEAWIQGNVPTAYAKQTLSTAQKKLHKQTE
jgi:uncharacterized metal-binding protein